MVKPYIGPGQPFPYDPDAIYFVLTSSDISVSGLCTAYCGFHFFEPYNATSDFIYGYVGAPGACMQACGYQ